MKRILFVILLILTACSPRPGNLLDMRLRGHENLALHIHPTLEIEVDGETLPIPLNMGAEPGKMRLIHTHEEPNVLHVESPVPHTFVIGDFFTIYGKTFNRDCIYEYCIDDEHTLTVTVNGVPDDRFEKIELRDKDVIRIVYAHKNDTK